MLRSFMTFLVFAVVYVFDLSLKRLHVYMYDLYLIRAHVHVILQITFSRTHPFEFVSSSPLRLTYNGKNLFDLTY